MGSLLCVECWLLPASLLICLFGRVILKKVYFEAGQN
jgi:hypothetical protein